MQHSQDNNKDEENLRDNLEKRYGAPVCQHILDEIEKTKKAEKQPPVNYMEIKELSELMERSRASAVNLIWKMKLWRNRERMNPAMEACTAIEGVFLAKQLRESLNIYKAIQHNYYCSRKMAVNQIYSYNDGNNQRCAA